MKKPSKKPRLKNVVCKPCWELKYCPYGPLVEDFPLPPMTQGQVDREIELLEARLATGQDVDGNPLDQHAKRRVSQEIRYFKGSTYPVDLPQVVRNASCRVFGHICPVFFMAEPLTETAERRKSGRTVSREVMLKVVRRDGQICQSCHEPVPDNEVEFDHVIPFARGGTSTADNLRLVHRKCNRKKSDSLGEILAPDPLLHLWELRRKAARSRRGK